MDEANADRRPARLDEPVLRLRRAQDLVEAVPYLLGFHPRSSVVLVGLAARASHASRVTITARVDIADLAGQAAMAASSAQTATHTAISVAGSGATRVVGVVFAGPRDDSQTCQRAIRCAGRACQHAGLDVGEWLVATPSGDSLPAPGVIATAATYAGLVARPDRESMVALLDPQPSAERELLRPGLERAGSIRRQAIRAGRGDRFHRGSVRALFSASRALFPVDDAQVVRLGAALADIAVRDACWLAVEARRIDGENLWRELARRLPAPYDAAPLFLFGWLRWRAGDGALAGIAARAALASDPDCRAASLLEGALASGMDPFRTPKLRKGA